MNRKIAQELFEEISASDEEKLSINDAIDIAWNWLFEVICKEHDDLHELKIEYSEETTGKTITRSWQDREKMLGGEKE